MQTEQFTALPRRASATEVPILDLGDWIAGGPPDDLVRQLDAVCTSTGFLYVRQHGIPRAVVDNVFDATRRYFARPMEERLRDKIDERFRRGFMPYGVTQHPGHKPDLKESYEVGVDLPLDDPDVVAGLPLHGPNRWPADAPWLKDAAETYVRHTTALGKRLLRLFALALGEREEFFLQWCNKPMVQARLFHYPPQESPTDMELGAAKHTDYGMITILAQDPIGGLELCKRDGEWIAAPWIEDTLVVNLGDMFKVWTGMSPTRTGWSTAPDANVSRSPPSSTWNTTRPWPACPAASPTTTRRVMRRCWRATTWSSGFRRCRSTRPPRSWRRRRPDRPGARRAELRPRMTWMAGCRPDPVQRRGPEPRAGRSRLAVCP